MVTAHLEGVGKCGDGLPAPLVPDDDGAVVAGADDQ